MLKKYIRSLVVIFACAAALSALFVYLELTAENTQDFNMVSINEFPTDETEARQREIAQTFKVVLRSAFELDDASFSPSVQLGASFVTHVSGQAENRYDLYIESVAKKAGYLYDGLNDEWMRLSPEGFTLLGKIEELSSVFMTPRNPQLFLVNASDSSVLANTKSGTWFYAEPTGYYVQSPVAAEETRESVIAQNGTYFACTKAPNRLAVTVTDESGKIVFDRQVVGTETLDCFVSGGRYIIKAQAVWDKTIDNDCFGQILYEFSVRVR